MFVLLIAYLLIGRGGQWVNIKVAGFYSPQIWVEYLMQEIFVKFTLLYVKYKTVSMKDLFLQVKFTT